jgi:hypothetical protein
MNSTLPAQRNELSAIASSGVHLRLFRGLFLLLYA